MVMSDVQTAKKFECRVPITAWDPWELWLEGRGTLNNTQVFVGFVRLFLRMPTEVQLKALFGTEAELEAELRKQGLTPPGESRAAQADQILADAAAQRAQSPRSSADRRRSSGGG
jgi:hypothetical protein